MKIFLKSGALLLATVVAAVVLLSSCGGAATLTSIAVTPAAPSIAEGATQQFTATGTLSDNSTVDLTATATWASSDAAVAAFETPDINGLATAIAAGTATISATDPDSGISSTDSGGDATITVTPAAPTNLVATAGDEQVTLAWDAVEDVDSYTIFWKESAGVTESDNSITGATSPYTHTGLAGGTTYYYAVASVKDSVDSDLSNEASAAIYSCPRAIVTSVQGTGKLGGWPEAAGATSLAAGDAICQSLAADAGLEGTFKALLSSNTVDARDRITTDGPWTRVDKVLVADNKSDLFDGTLNAPINLTETGASLSTNVWTGSNADGTTYAKTCSGWTDEGGAQDGRYGIADVATSSWWISTQADPCDSTFSLYCLED